MRIAIYLGLLLWGLTTITIPTIIYGKLLMTLGAIVWLLLCVAISIGVWYYFYLKQIENDHD